LRLTSGRYFGILIKLFFFLFILYNPAGMLLAEDKILIYYFKNITGDDRYNDLEYKISVCLYRELRARIGKKGVYLIRPDTFEKYSIGRDEYFDENFLINLFSREKIDKVLFGYFFLLDGRIEMRGRLLSVDSGVIVDITEAQKELYDVIQKVEGLVKELQGRCELDKKTKYFSPGKKARKVAIKEETAITGLLVWSGIIFPVFEWGKYYDPGVFGSFNFYYTPKPMTFPLGFGTQFFYYYLEKTEDLYLGSKLNGLGVQPMLTYIKERSGFFSGYGLLFGVGGGLSILFVNEADYLSIDPSVSASFFLIISPFKGLKITLNAGAYSVIYKSYPFTTYTLSIGVKSGTLLKVKK